MHNLNLSVASRSVAKSNIYFLPKMIRKKAGFTKSLNDGERDQSLYFSSNFQYSTNPSCHIGSRRALSEAEGQPFATIHFGFAQCPINCRRERKVTPTSTQGTISIYRSETIRFLSKISTFYLKRIETRLFQGSFYCPTFTINFRYSRLSFPCTKPTNATCP
jgi:hypothetical protein